MSQQFRAELSEESLVLSPAATSEGESHLFQPITERLGSHLTPVSLRPQVNLIPGLMDAFSDAGAGLCHMSTWSHLKGESAASGVN